MTGDSTLAAYDRFAAEYAEDWLTQDTPSDLYADFAHWLRPNGETVDVGCGCGREVAWLNANGYPAVGFDASVGLLVEARRRFPALSFRYAILPALAEIDRQFDNVVCETVIMHLPRGEIGAAARRLARITRPGGTLYLSWRVTQTPDGEDQFDARGRRYACFTADVVTNALHGMEILESQERISRSSGKRIGIAVARKTEEL
jgi:SAM-dependent methyltransferase